MNTVYEIQNFKISIYFLIYILKEKMEDKIKILNDKIALAKLGGGEKRIAKHHEKKKLTARERVELSYG